MKLPKTRLAVSLFVLAATLAIAPFSRGAPATPGGISLSILYSFTNAATPQAALVQGANGSFYGTTAAGGANGFGAVFLLTPGGVFTNLVSFLGTNGAMPAAPLFLDANGNFYGTTSSGGINNDGTLFVMSPSGAFTNLVRFSGTNGANPSGGVVRSPKGYLYGTTSAGGANGLGEVFSWSAGTGLSNRYSFSGTDGSNPQGGVVVGSDGNFYGTTYEGGANGLGTVFQLTPSNTLSTLVSFSFDNGAFPLGLAQASNGVMFGATSSGGSNDFGTVFEVTRTGSLTTLITFGINGGSDPRASATLGADGLVYGTTVHGGADGLGVIYRVSTNAATGSASRGSGRGGPGASSATGTNSVVVSNLVSFSGLNGAYPQAGLLQAKDGNFYGTTTSGGANGFGNIFQLLGFPPSIYQQPTNQNLALKGTADFSVGATGSAALGYQWSRNGINLSNGGNIAGATNSELTISAETLLNAGSYAVIVTNAYGAATSAVVTLTVPIPGIAIKAPAAAVANAVLTVVGTATDKYGLSTVQWQVNGGAWNPAATVNQWTNWSAKVILQGGSNIFRAYSADLLGNHSQTNSVNVFYITHSSLALFTNGFGTIVHGADSALVVDQAFTIKAVPQAGNLFSNWTGSITVTNNPLTFLMGSNMTLTANFVTNSFLRAVGTYNGLFYVAGGIGAESSGLLAGLAVGNLGIYSGKLYVSGTAYGVTGGFDLAGDASNQIARTAILGPLSLAMHLNWNITPPQITGTVQGTNGGAWTAELTNELAGTGLHSAEDTLLIPPGAGAPLNSPGGDGYALITNHLGTVTVTGSLADGAAFNETVAESENLRLPFYATPYTNGGLLLGWLDLGGGAPAGSLTWIRPAAPRGLFTNGYTNLVTVQSSAWTNLGTKNPAISLPNGQLDLSGGFLTAPLNFEVGLATNSTLVVSPHPNIGPAMTPTLSGSIAPKTGLLSITFSNGNGKASTAGTGAALQNLNTAGGFFTTATNAGAITLTPAAGP